MIKINHTHLLYALIAILLFMQLDGCSYYNRFRESTVEKVRTEDTEYITTKKLDSVIQNVLSQHKGQKQTIVIREDRVVPVENNYKLEPGDSAIVKETHRYKDTTKLDNGTIYSDIIADSLYSKKFTLATTDTLVKKTVFDFQKVVKSNMYYGLGTTIGLDGRIKDIEATLNYTHKNKWQLEVGPQYDLDALINLPPEKRAGMKFKVGLSF